MPIPIELEFISAFSPQTTQKLTTFTSYQFERNLLSPAAPFRFTAPGVNRDVRMSIRSGDAVQIFAYDSSNRRWPIAFGIVDETDTHGSGERVDYTISGRDILGQLVDNASVDANNNVQYIQTASLRTICARLIQNTRIPQGFTFSQVPNGNYMFSSNSGETKMNALQRMLEWANLLVWSSPDGQMIVGKPNFTQGSSGLLLSMYAGGNGAFDNNITEFSVRRNLNQAIRQVAVQLQDLSSVSPASLPNITMENNDIDVLSVADQGVGRSVYEVFDYGNGGDTLNLLAKVGNQSANYQQIGQALAARRIAMENMKVLDVEAVVKDHVNTFGGIYSVDQVYGVVIDDEEISDPLYAYSVSYDLTESQGMTTRLKLCKLNTIVSGSRAIG